MTQAVIGDVVSVEPYHTTQLIAVQALLVNAGWRDDAVPHRNVLKSAAEERTAFVALSADQVVGFARIISDALTVSYLAEIAVEPGLQMQGIGRALIEACGKRFPTARLDLLSTADAQPFYEHVGFHARPGYRRWLWE